MNDRNVFIETDLEGISGVASIEETWSTEPTYPHTRQRLMADVNAAVAGAFAGGASQVFVRDGHGGGGNFIVEALDPRATLVTYADDRAFIENIGCIMQLGAHAMAGTAMAFLDHTQSSKTIYNFIYNGKRTGEMGQTGIFGGVYGVPCVAMSGDRAACEEAVAFFGDAIRTAEVKTATCRNKADCIGDEEAEARIFEAFRKGFELRHEMKPYTVALPLEVIVEFFRADYCEAKLVNRPDEVRLDARSLRFVKDRIESFYDLLP